MPKFTPAFDCLDAIISLSAFGHRPHHHAAHVRPHTVTPPPHQVQQPRHTGTLISGELTATASDAAALSSGAGTITLSGEGSIQIGRKSYACGVGLSTHDQIGSLFISVGNDRIVADVIVLADCSAGNYRVTQATGNFAGLKGTGVFSINQTAAGLTLAFNSHQ